VCTITINSTEERDTFKKNLGSEQFQFLELAPATQEGNPSWFEDACREGVQCDLLVISGHFGGKFFGDDLKSPELYLDQMEAASCNNACDGILKNPKEVFLFGCNTLASKEKDHRSYEELVNIYTTDGYSTSFARRQAAIRYSPVGSSFKSRMQRTFEGVPVIVGFDSVSPRGANVKPYLDRYFHQFQSDKKTNPQDQYSAYLAKLSLEKDFQNLSQSPGAHQTLGAKALKPFRTLTSILEKNTTAADCGGFKVGEDPLRDLICSLHSENLSREDQLAYILRTLDNDNLLEAWPVIANYLNQMDIDSLSSSERLILEQIKANKNAKEIFLKNKNLIDIDQMTETRVSLEEMGVGLGWIDPEASKKFRLAYLKKAFSDGIDREELDVFCSIKSGLQGLISSEQLKSQSMNPQISKALKCLKPGDPHLVTLLLEEEIKTGDRWTVYSEDLFRYLPKEKYPAELEKVFFQIIGNSYDSSTLSHYIQSNKEQPDMWSKLESQIKVSSANGFLFAQGVGVENLSKWPSLERYVKNSTSTESTLTFSKSIGFWLSQKKQPQEFKQRLQNLLNRDTYTEAHEALKENLQKYLMKNSELKEYLQMIQSSKSSGAQQLWKEINYP